MRPEYSNGSIIIWSNQGKCRIGVESQWLCISSRKLLNGDSRTSPAGADPTSLSSMATADATLKFRMQQKIKKKAIF